MNAGEDPQASAVQLDLVGGFLGSGKTTAIIQAAKRLMSRGLRVGVITNDQGKYLVDTAFVRLSALPAVEVSGGCFCCNYDDLNSRLDDLLTSARPDVVFAESVGSCADIVATVVKPLLTLGSTTAVPTSFSVFADARILLRRLRDEDLPFSDDVMYIYDQQLEEAGLIVVNKIDLLTADQKDEIAERIDRRYAGRAVVFQNSLVEGGVSDWLQAIADGRAKPPRQSLQMDYQRYAAGEASLAWMDQELHLSVPEGYGKEVITELVRRITHLLSEKSAGIGHLKLIIRASAVETKLSFPTLEEPGWQDRIPNLTGTQVDLLINARAELPADELLEILRQALRQPGVEVIWKAGEAFHPKEPHPTHRYL